MPIHISKMKLSDLFNYANLHIRCFLKFELKVGVEKSIVNALRITNQVFKSFKSNLKNTRYKELRRTYLQDVTEIGALTPTGNRTRQKEQLFYLPFCRKTMFNSKKKKLERFFTKITLRH
jgi:hypothetical protein